MSKSQPTQRAATMGAGFTGLPHVVQDSPAYRSLSLYGRAVLTQLLRRFNGYNNGRIAVSQRELADEIGSTNFRKIAAATAELMDRGLVYIASEGAYRQRHAREFRLTFISTGDDKRHVAATNDYRSWTPQKAFSGADDVSAGNTNLLTTHQQAPHNPADDVSADGAIDQRKTAIFGKLAADDVSALICKPYPRVCEGDGDPQIYPLNLGGVFATCEHDGCNSRVIGSGTGAVKRFCSERCRKAAERARAYHRSKLAAT